MNLRAGMIAAGTLALLASGFGPAAAGSLVSIGLAGGVSVPVNDVASAFDDGVAGQGFVKFNIPFIITPRLDFVFQDMDIKDPSIVSPDFGPGNFTGGTQQIMSGLAHAQFNLLTAGPITPYLLLGVGISNLETTLDEEGGGSTSRSSTQVTVDGGAGVLVKVGPIKAFVEGRLANVVNDGEVIDFESVQTVPVTLGIVVF
jgi:opacity protein-like surface antigen